MCREYGTISINARINAYRHAKVTVVVKFYDLSNDNSCRLFINDVSVTKTGSNKCIHSLS